MGAKLFIRGLKERACWGLIGFAVFAFAIHTGSVHAQIPNPATYINWETPPVHPLDLSPDGLTLALANLPNNRVELFDLSMGIPILSATIPVGIDPVSVRWRTSTELWVVNFISDSVSIIDSTTKRVIATINKDPLTTLPDNQLDEPQDVVFAGAPQRAFISCGNVNNIQVFDPVTRTQTATVAIDAEEPRALAVSPDGTKVYVAIFESGNSSTILGGGLDSGGATLAFPPNAVSDPAGSYGGTNPPPNTGGVGGTFNPPQNGANGTPPKVGLIVKKNTSGQWMDDNGQDWTSMVSGANAAKSGRPVGWQLIDHDLATINASTLAVTYADRMMNIVMSVGVNPGNGWAYVIGTDATNEIRYEPNVKGKFTRVEVAAVDATGATVQGVIDLNSHLNYSTSTVPQSERDKSIGDPRGIVWNSAGTLGYITGMGSNNLIVINQSGGRVNALPTNVGEGPAGLALDEPRGRLYVQNRFEETISVLDSSSLVEISRIPYNYQETPQVIKTGRKHLYDTHKNSGLGQIACGSCHIDGKMDRLAWDLGDPSGSLKSTAGENNLGGVGALAGSTLDPNFHSMKGPMTTQTLQDIVGKEPFHWRGDRDGIEEFNGAFISLNGDDTNLTATEMQQFEDFLATIYFPPNPYRNFDNTLRTNLALTGRFTTGRFGLAGQPLPNGNAVNGLNLYRTGRHDNNAVDCVTCHTLPVGAGANRTATIAGNNITFNTIPPGTNGNLHLFLTGADGSTQDAIKVPQLRNMFKKEGMEFQRPIAHAGFGFTHDGAVDSLARFVSEPIFTTASDQNVADLVAFVISFAGSDLPLGNTTGTLVPFNVEPLGELGRDTHAGVGKQVTINSGAANTIINAMIAEANENGANPTRGIDLVVKGKSVGVDRGWVWDRATAKFKSDRDSDPEITQAALMALAAPGSELTFTAVPRGTGTRIGIDQDEDGFGDRTEIEACTDPANPLSHPGAAPFGPPSETIVSGNSLAFGNQDISAGPTAPLATTVGNSGTGSLFFKGAKFVIVGPNADDFAVSNSPSTSPLASGSTLGINVTFNPSTIGSKTATLLIITNDCSNPTRQIPLSGIGSSGAASPTASPTTSPTASPTGSPTPTATPSPSATSNVSPTASVTSTPSSTSSVSPTASATPTPSPNAARNWELFD